VRAIAQNIEEKVKKHLKLNAFHTEGYENSQWILLDYNSVVVHIFQEKTRNYYKLEELWADCLLTIYPDEE
jgi:ribosome-associated protein